jgi:hydrogenase assembly chaperone HypC/HupF
VLGVDGTRAQVDIGGVSTWIDAALLPHLSAGDYVLVHAGLALEQLSSEDAEALLSVYASVDDAFEARAE